MNGRGVVVVAVALSLGGCAGLGEKEFACPGPPGEPLCLSASEVYRATDGADALVRAPQASESDESHPETGDSAGAPPAPAAPEGAPLSALLPRPEGPEPFRTPARVMRVWIGPWEDTRGDLHAPGYVYTEIEPRRWQIGAPAPTTPAVLTPLQIEPREAPPKEAPSPRPERPRGARGERGLAAPNGR